MSYIIYKLACSLKNHQATSTTLLIFILIKIETKNATKSFILVSFVSFKLRENRKNMMNSRLFVSTHLILLAILLARTSHCIKIKLELKIINEDGSETPIKLGNESMVIFNRTIDTSQLYDHRHDDSDKLNQIIKQLVELSPIANLTVAETTTSSTPDNEYDLDDVDDREEDDEIQTTESSDRESFDFDYTTTRAAESEYDDYTDETTTESIPTTTTSRAKVKTTSTTATTTTSTTTTTSKTTTTTKSTTKVTPRSTKPITVLTTTKSSLATTLSSSTSNKKTVSTNSTRLFTTTTTKTTSTSSTPNYYSIICTKEFDKYCVNRGECYLKLNQTVQPYCECKSIDILLYGCLKVYFTGPRCQYGHFSLTWLGWFVFLFISFILFTLCGLTVGACCSCSKSSNNKSKSKSNEQTDVTNEDSVDEKADAEKVKAANTSWEYLKVNGGKPSDHQSSRNNSIILSYLEKRSRNIFKSLEGLMGKASAPPLDDSPTTVTTHQSASPSNILNINENFIFVNRSFNKSHGDLSKFISDVASTNILFGKEDSGKGGLVDLESGACKLDARCSSNVYIYPPSS